MSAVFDIRGIRVELAALLQLQVLAKHLPQLSRQETRRQQLGEQRSRWQGQGKEFRELKAYQSGDDVRRIDWHQTAKRQQPFVRVMEEDHRHPHVVWLPLTPSLFFGSKRCLKSVMACHWTSLLLWRMACQKHPVRLLVSLGDQWLVDTTIRRDTDVAAACQQLVKAHQQLADNFSSIPNQPLPALPAWQPAQTLWVVSDFEDGLSPDALRPTIERARLTALHCLQLVDALEQTEPLAHPLPVSNGQDIRWFQGFAKQASEVSVALAQLCHQYRGLHSRHFTHQFEWSEVVAWPLYH